LGGAPDPFVEIYVDGVYIGRTSTVQDYYNATWNEQATITLNSDSELFLDIWDEDLTLNDEIGNLTLNTEQLLKQLIKEGHYSAKGGPVVEFNISISPK
jgi:Ca2+-dependent lipid-binding protein